VIRAHRDVGDLRQRGKARQLGGAHHLIADEDVTHAAPDEDLGLAYLLHALTDCAARNLQVRDHG
jgi:hypothetical protein